MIQSDLHYQTVNSSYLECSHCHNNYSTSEINTICSCGGPLIVHYTYHLTPSINSSNSLWRYSDLLPVRDLANIVSLGEGNTPIITCSNLMKYLGVESILLKDEGQNPTGSFKARGMALAVSMAKELGVERCVIPTAGNAGGAMSAYCAKAGIPAIVVMPVFTPEVFKTECRYYGAEVIEVDGLIDKCGKKAKEISYSQYAFNVATMKEPYRLEGKKTIGFEIAEQLDWQLPDVILCPTGGGTGLIGVWKAFNEMKELGWIKKPFPRMIAVQAANCQPVVDTYLRNDPAKVKSSVANGLAVPAPFAMDEIMAVLKESNGMAISVSEDELMTGVKLIAKYEGLFIAPEGGAIVASISKLVNMGELTPSDNILLLNTGTGYKYTKLY